MAEASTFDQILDPANRVNPFPLYARLRETPVTRLADGTYVVSTYNEIVALLHDPRLSSDYRAGAGAEPGAPPAPEYEPPEYGSPGPDDAPARVPPGFIRRDPPEHDRLRGLAMRHFGPPCTPGLIDGLRPWLTEVSDGLLDSFAGKNRADIVDDFAYPLPVTAICRLLGVPREDEPRFHGWADGIIEALDPNAGTPEERARMGDQVRAELRRYLNELADAHASKPGDDMMSGLISDPGPSGSMSRADLLATSELLLVAGHETTVNLITSGMLTLLRHPGVLDRLRNEPGLIIGLVEELLRYEPPVHMLPWRVTLADIDIAGTTIPAGSPVSLVLASGSRDPKRFDNPDRFDPDRIDNQHLGFGGGIHYCFGAALARTEAQIALPELAGRLVNPRLVADPPPYRPSPILRGPRHLQVEYDAVAPAASRAVQAGSVGRSG